jgi:hypothetical protein
MRRVLTASLVALVGAACAHPSAVFVQTDKDFRKHTSKEPPVVLYEARDVAAAKPFRTVGVLEIRRVEADSLNTFEAQVVKEGTSIGCEILAQRDTYEMRTQQLPPYSPNYLGNPSGTWRVNGFAAWQFFCGMWGDKPVEPGTARYTRKVATEAAISLRNEGRGEVICTHTSVGDSRIRKDLCADAQGLSADSTSP